MSTRIHQKRVTLNRRNSSLLLDSQAMLTKTSNDYINHHNYNSGNAITLTTSLVEATFKKEVSVPQVSSRLHNILMTSSPTSTTATTTTTTTSVALTSPFMLKPSLRLRGVNSAPCTPKSVHFDQNNLENICLFRKAQTPSSIRQRGVFWADEDDDQNSSPASSSNSSDNEDEGEGRDDRYDEYDNENVKVDKNQIAVEDHEDEDDEEEEIVRELVYTNWPNRLADILNKKNKVVRVEKSHLKLKDNQDMIGKVLVKNLDYHKTVMVRYTFDFWETVENVQAFFYQHHKIYDVFSFTIDHIPAETHTLYFAVCYNVGGQEYWDNNNGKNYEIQIVNKKKKQQHQQQQQPHTQEGKNLRGRYDFGQSIHQAKKLPNTATSYKPSYTTGTMAMPIPITSRRRSMMMVSRDSYLSSSPTSSSCHSPMSSSPTSFMELNSQSYRDLVNKYCFYSTSPTRSPMSING